MNKSTQNLIDTTTPFVVLALPNKVELRQYWTKGGTYGPQVVTVIFDYPNEVWTYKTSGCGYCKQSQGLMMAWEHLGYKPVGQGDNSKISYDLHVGGNFHKLEADAYLTKNHNGKLISVTAFEKHGLTFND